MALDAFTGPIANALASAPQAGVGGPNANAFQPGPSAATPPAEQGANFDPFINAVPDAGRSSAINVPSMPPPSSIQQLSRPPLNTLGNDVLNSLERFGSRVQTLQSVGTKAGQHGALPEGPASSAISPAGGPPDPMSEIKKAYADIFEKSMDHQKHMFGLMIEVNLGHTVASNVTSTAKTMLTQSG